MSDICLLFHEISNSSLISRNYEAQRQLSALVEPFRKLRPGYQTPVTGGRCSLVRMRGMVVISVAIQISLTMF